MKTFLWLCITILSWAILLILYADYNTRVADFLCNTVNYCKNIQDTDIILDQENETFTNMSWFVDVIYTTWTQLYEVSFDLSDPQQQELFDKYSATNPTCEVDGPYGIGGGPWCSNITWFTHTYTYPKLWLSVLAYGRIIWTQDITTNPWLFSPYLENPFVWSSNSISFSLQQWLSVEIETISYREFKNWETIDSIIEEAKTKKIDGMSYYTATEYDPQGVEGFKGTDYILHSVNYRDFKNNKDRNNFYIFKPWKSYYYIIDRQWEETCIPVACGLASHGITYFTK